MARPGSDGSRGIRRSNATPRLALSSTLSWGRNQRRSGVSRLFRSIHTLEATERRSSVFHGSALSPDATATSPSRLSATARSTTAR